MLSYRKDLVAAELDCVLDDFLSSIRLVAKSSEIVVLASLCISSTTGTFERVAETSLPVVRSVRR
jgi:hypothetical protein